MKEIKSFLLILGFLAATFTGIHYFMLLTGLSDLVALVLFALPSTLVIAYSTTETPREMVRRTLSIYGWFVSVILATTLLVWFIG